MTTENGSVHAMYGERTSRALSSLLTKSLTCPKHGLPAMPSAEKRGRTTCKECTRIYKTKPDGQYLWWRRSRRRWLKIQENKI